MEIKLKSGVLSTYQSLSNLHIVSENLTDFSFQVSLNFYLTEANTVPIKSVFITKRNLIDVIEIKNSLDEILNEDKLIKIVDAE